MSIQAKIAQLKSQIEALSILASHPDTVAVALPLLRQKRAQLGVAQSFAACA